ncbi:hypothetical protein VP01_4191g3 [Puccinia sorghi]|uniref:Uncharacterized protein n=1 Tax=Puccinia sorghi TaxID=27349 RepID=A0A0L6UST4_9BASI|nr:hypothetical protein VP01_4191g3 [Puccinia sorghi]
MPSSCGDAVIGDQEGKLILTANGNPFLLSSATCCPIKIKKTLELLKLTNEMVEFILGEITLPEIFILRINMKNSLASSDHLVVFCSPKSKPLTVLNLLKHTRDSR